MSVLTLGTQEVDVEINDEMVQEFLDIFAPIIPMLIAIGKDQAMVILNSLFSEDSYDGLNLLRNNCTDDEWYGVVENFVVEATKFNEKAVANREAATALAGKALIGILFALL